MAEQIDLHDAQYAKEGMVQYKRPRMQIKACLDIGSDTSNDDEFTQVKRKKKKRRIQPVRGGLAPLLQWWNLKAFELQGTVLKKRIWLSLLTSRCSCSSTRALKQWAGNGRRISMWNLMKLLSKADLLMKKTMTMKYTGDRMISSEVFILIIYAQESSRHCNRSI